jgi:multiple sugar transport system permease protein
VFLLTAGGPGTSTELVNLHLYKVFFEQNRLGYGALLSLAVIAAIVAFLLVAWRATLAVRAVPSPQPSPRTRGDGARREASSG